METFLWIGLILALIVIGGLAWFGYHAIRFISAMIAVVLGERD